MIADRHHYDLVVLGSGPAGQKAAIQGAKAGRAVLVVEQDRDVGGACVHHGTIPSKTLRETAVSMRRRRASTALDIHLDDHTRVDAMMGRLNEVISAHERYIADQLRRNGVDRWVGRARFIDAHTLEIRGPNGGVKLAAGDHIVVATGSRPRAPEQVAVDHEHVLDSDSILSMNYLPESLIVLGGGVIACEYASIFAALGVKVTLVDKSDRPLTFMDSELTDRFVQALGEMGGSYLGNQAIQSVAWDGVSAVVVTLASGISLRSDKVLCALGRLANLESLDVEKAGLSRSARGYIDVDAHCRTAVPHIYAVGDVIGPPALASSAMEQGRRAVRHALGLPAPRELDIIPTGIFTLPEMASIGLDERGARTKLGGVMVGRAKFCELARGQIAGSDEGFMKLIADPEGHRILGVQIIGDGAAELIHVGQMAMIGGVSVDGFIDNVFNFPTLAEAYRVAALDIARQRLGVAQDAA
ncbi:MAG: Si-specific NAD(P)(+) transhydrogenase [Myxococcota bacterium]